MKRLFGASKEEDQNEARFSELTERVEELTKQVNQLKSQLKQVVDRLETMETQLSEPAHTEVESEPQPVISEETIIHPTGPQCYYLGSPDSDGYFSSFSQQEQIGKSIYQLTSVDGRSGNFILLDTPDAIATAMISVSQFLKPACKIEGNLQQQPRHVITEEEGEAVREGEGWRVTRKALIKFD